MPETPRKYDPIKRREYYLRTRELKGRGRGLTRYSKKGKGSDELRRDEEARLASERELRILAEKLKQEKAKGNENTPAYRQMAEAYVKNLDSHRKFLTNTYARAGGTVLDVGERTARGMGRQGVGVAKTYGRAGMALGNQAANVADAYRDTGVGAAKLAADLASGRVVETNETRAGKFIVKTITKHGRKGLKTVTGL